MKLFLNFLSLVFFFNPFVGNAQLNELDLEKEFIVKLDSLFIHHKYSEIIEECKRVQPRYNIKTAEYNLIATMYFIGNKDSAFSLLDKRLLKFKNCHIMTDILLGDYTSYRTFIEVPEVNTYIMSRIYQKQRSESLVDSINARRLLNFFIEDQTKSFKSKAFTKILSNTRFPYNGLLDDSTYGNQWDQLLQDVFNFYQLNGKLFSEKEVGSVFNAQKLLLFHCTDLKQREFYLGLVKNAVKNNIFPIQLEIDFQVYTEMIEIGKKDAKKKLQSIVEKYRRLYGISDYEYGYF